MKNTSWGGVAKWYDNLIEKEPSNYQKDLILPNLLRVLDIKTQDNVLDLACGQGFFSEEIFKSGAVVMGVDISPELIKLAKDKSAKEKTAINFFASPAHRLDFIGSSSIDKVVIVLAIQNIENINDVFKEVSRVLKPTGKLFIVMNHPAFRVPKVSSWGNDDAAKVQYRRIDGYMSESKNEIKMHPGEKPREVTISFHRPLQVYFKAFKKAGFVVSSLEEWTSNKTSEPGPRAKAENIARKEIPLFLMMELAKVR